MSNTYKLISTIYECQHRAVGLCEWDCRQNMQSRPLLVGGVLRPLVGAQLTPLEGIRVTLGSSKTSCVLPPLLDLLHHRLRCQAKSWFENECQQNMK